jgi:hypothetical protein
VHVSQILLVAPSQQLLSYLQDNKDLEISGLKNKEDALFHYTNYGITP